MNTPTPSPIPAPETAHVVDSIRPYLAGGLPPHDRLRFVDGRLSWDGRSGNDARPVAVQALSAPQRDGRNANAVDYIADQNSDGLAGPAEMGRRVQVALTSNAANPNATALHRGFEV